MHGRRRRNSPQWDRPADAAEPHRFPTTAWQRRPSTVGVRRPCTSRRSANGRLYPDRTERMTLDRPTRGEPRRLDLEPAPALVEGTAPLGVRAACDARWRPRPGEVPRGPTRSNRLSHTGCPRLRWLRPPAPEVAVSTCQPPRSGQEGRHRSGRERGGVQRRTAARTGPPHRRVLDEDRSRQQVEARSKGEPGGSTSRIRAPPKRESSTVTVARCQHVEPGCAGILHHDPAVSVPRAARERRPPAHVERRALRFDPDPDRGARRALVRQLFSG